MDNILDQQAIDALVRSAQRGTGVLESPAGPVVRSWDAHQAHKIGDEQLRSLNQLHQTFARNLGDSLGALLRVPCECALISAEHLSYVEFLATIPAIAYFAGCTVTGGQAAALLLELPISLVLVDLLLGGEGACLSVEREMTDIEGQIVENAVQMVCRELQKAWQGFALEIRFEQRRSADEMRWLMPAEEKNLCLNFEIKISQTRGTMSLALPAAASNSMLRKMCASNVHERPRGTPETRERLQQALRASVFSVELVQPNLKLPCRCLGGMTRGTLLSFSRSVLSPAVLEVDGMPVCTASPVRLNSRRAAQVIQLTSA